MSLKVSGVQGKIILQSEESGSVDLNGVGMLTLVEELPASQFPRLVRARYSPHPRFPGMAVSRISWQLAQHGQFYRVTYLFEGTTTGQNLPEPVYRLAAALAEEPIQIHPDFQKFAGTPKVPLNGAIFVDAETRAISTDGVRAVFAEFAITDKAGKANKKAGIDSFLSPGATWSEISFSTAVPTDIGDLGAIDKPRGPCPTFGANRTWIYYSADYTRRGNIYEIQKTWLLSARGGWDSDIYK